MFMFIIILQITHLHSTIVKEASLWKNGHQHHLEETGRICLNIFPLCNKIKCHPDISKIDATDNKMVLT